MSFVKHKSMEKCLLEKSKAPANAEAGFLIT